MSFRRHETPYQTVRRHLRNGYIILTERGFASLFGAAMREAAKLLDSPVGPFLAPKNLLSHGPALVRAHGGRAALAAFCRQIAIDYDPPLGESGEPIDKTMIDAAIRYHYVYELTKPDGVIPSRRPMNDVDYALETPFSRPAPPHLTGPIAVIVHAFYPEVLPGLLEKIAHIPGRVDLFLSTDAPDKAKAIAEMVAHWPQGKSDIRILPNRGRDIGAKFVGFSDIYARYDVFLHLHTKKSPHGGAPLARWRDYLIDTLIGSPEIARANLSLFNDPKIGVVFPQHLLEIRGILNWGYDYDCARALLARMGVDLNKNLALEFPSGSMFWGRGDAIKPLLAAGLTYEDFPSESGQVDGTLAHAIERIVLMVAESAGFEWLKVARRDLYPWPQTILKIEGPQDLPAARLKVFQPTLAPVDGHWPACAHPFREARPIMAYPSRNRRPRLNLLVPTINPHQSFGGIETAIALFERTAEACGQDFDRRVIVCDAEIAPEGYARLPDYEPLPCLASLDDRPRAVVDAFERALGRLDLRAGDIFMATAWWTARHARALNKERGRFFGVSAPFVYLIQDDEPHFYGWSAQYALAQATYHATSDYAAVINSEELFSAMTAHYTFQQAYCLPYALNAKLDASLAPRPRERMLLVYGRPAVARNLYPLICLALHVWQQRDPIRASRWRIVFLGEHFDQALAEPLQNVEICGKASLEDYADYLSRAAVGLSLMLSPHPSYPPLEMAHAGLMTVVNAYAGKDLRARFDNVAQVEQLEPLEIAKAVEQAVAAMEPHIGKITPRGTPKPVITPSPFSTEALAAFVRNSASAALRGQQLL